MQWRMEPTCRTRAVIGICCLLPVIWLVPEIVLDLLYNPYVTLTTTRSILSLTSLIAGFLLLTTIGLSLLTGKYNKHRRAFHRIWLALGVLAVGPFLWVWVTATTVP